MTKQTILAEFNHVPYRVIKTLFLPFLMILIFILISFSFFFITQTSNVIKNNYRENLKYWLTVGDSFQIERAIKYFNDHTTDWHMQLLHEGYTYPQKSTTNFYYRITFDHEVNVQDRVGTIRLTTRYPVGVVFVVFVLFLIFLSLFFYLVRRRIANIVNSLKTPLDDFVQRISNIKTLDFKVLAGENFKYHEFNLLSDSLLNMAKRVDRQEKEIKEIENEIFKSDLLKDVSHDIRGPLDTQKMLLESISPKITLEERQVLTMSVERIESITERILKSARGLLQVYSTDEVRAGLIAHKVALARSNILLNIELEDGFIKVNPDRFESIITNLLENAKDAQASVIDVRGSKHNISYEIQITDNGKGIPKEVMTKIGHKGFTYGKRNGNGIGLYTSIKGVESFGGRFSISSEPSIGTTVKIVISE